MEGLLSTRPTLSSFHGLLPLGKAMVMGPPDFHLGYLNSGEVNSVGHGSVPCRPLLFKVTLDKIMINT